MSARKKSQFPPLSDEACIEQRRQTANLEEAEVVWVEKADAFRGTYEVSSSQWDQPYQVEIRDLNNLLNSCSCSDFRMNRLGTCKHIERVFDVITYRKSTELKQLQKKKLPREEIFVDGTGEFLRVRRLLPGGRSPKVASLIANIFDEEGFANGSLMDVWATLQSIKDGLSPRLKPLLHLSEHADYWLQREEFMLEQRRLQRDYDTALVTGRASDNPVLHPLYPYQKEGMRHLAFQGRALLADEMGLGKTVQAIAAAELLRQLGKIERVLVVCPASLKSEWEDQLAFFTGQEALPIFGPRSDRLRAYRSNHPFCICNYEQIRNDVEDINTALMPDLIILDEAQRIKNWPTLTAKTIKRLQSPYAFVLTGTPMENRIEELYSLMEFVDPHLFGTLERFQREFMKPSPENPLQMIPDNLSDLHRRVKRVMLRRRKNDVEDVLPERSDKTYFVPMLPEQEVRYNELSGQVAKILAKTKRRRLTKEELDKLQRLLACMRMTCDTPFILDQDCRECPKLSEMESILDERLDDPDCKMIIFSEWVRMLELVGEMLEDKGIGFTEHTGSVPQKKRREHLKEFKENPECRVLLSSESGGVGLNLQVANVVVNLDLPWNPAKLEQRIARAWRKHQKRRVHVLNLVTQDSIEEAMIGKLAYKTKLSESVLDGAEFKDDLRSEAGQRTFLDRVRTLMGHRTEATSTPPPPVGRKAQLLSEYASHILGIEEVSEDGPALVVARPDQQFANIASTLSEDTVLLTPEMHQMLQRMQELGMLTLNPKLKASHRSESYSPLAESRKVIPAPLRFPEAASAHWQKVQNERKAATALLELDLREQALPHVKQVLKNGQESIRILYSEDAEGALPEDMEIADRELAEKVQHPLPEESQDLLSLCKQLDEFLTV